MLIEIIKLQRIRFNNIIILPSAFFVSKCHCVHLHAAHYFSISWFIENVVSQKLFNSILTQFKNNCHKWWFGSLITCILKCHFPRFGMRIIYKSEIRANDTMEKHSLAKFIQQVLKMLLFYNLRLIFSVTINN